MMDSIATAEWTRLQSTALCERGADLHSAAVFVSPELWYSRFSQVTMSWTESPVQNENVGPLIQKSGISSRPERNSKASVGLCATTPRPRPRRLTSMLSRWVLGASFPSQAWGRRTQGTLFRLPQEPASNGARFKKPHALCLCPETRAVSAARCADRKLEKRGLNGSCVKPAMQNRRRENWKRQKRKSLGEREMRLTLGLE